MWDKSKEDGWIKNPITFNTPYGKYHSWDAFLNSIESDVIEVERNDHVFGGICFEVCYKWNASWRSDLIRYRELKPQTKIHKPQMETEMYKPDLNAHFIEKCKECGTVISQCRCPDPNKTITYKICENCLNIKAPIVLYRIGEEWQEEAKACEAYFPTTPNRTLIPPNSLVIGRYSCLPFYREFESDLKVNGSELINSYEQHNYIADLKEWYEDLKDYTPKTWNLAYEMPSAADGPFVLKGQTNSKKFLWDTHMFASDLEALSQVQSRLYEDGLISQQNIYARQFVKLRTFFTSFHGLPITNEFRFFCYKGEILSHGFYWSNVLDEVIEKLGSKPVLDPWGLSFARTIASLIGDKANYYVLDIGQMENGVWTLIELNDGQMSGLSENDPNILYKNLVTELKHRK